MAFGQDAEQRSPDGTPPIVFEMIEPIGCLDQERASSDLSIGDPDAVMGRAKMDLLPQLRGGSGINKGKPFHLSPTARFLGKRSVRVRFNHANEAVAHPVYRRDPVSAAGRLPQQLPQGSDLNGEIALFDGGALPSSVNK